MAVTLNPRIYIIQHHPVLKQIWWIICLFLIFISPLTAQEIILNYDLVYKGDVVGSLKHYQKRNVDNTFIKMVSTARLRFILNLHVYSEEESLFKGGRLLYSNIHRKVNGKTKGNKQTRLAGEYYETFSEGKTGLVHYKKIDFSLNMLYFQEPVGIGSVYSDNFQQFIAVKKVKDHTYHVEFPDGNYNYYSYTDGTCSKVEVYSTLYNFQLRLKNKTGGKSI
jgi:hypothetical protein